MLRMAMSNQRIDMMYREHKASSYGYIMKKICDRPTHLRKICTKRARKLRRLGETVVWNTELQSYVWEMRVCLRPHLRRAIRVYLNLNLPRYDLEAPTGFLDIFNIEGTRTARLVAP